MEVLKERSEHLHRRSNHVYQALIDLGAHPNVLGLEQMSEYHLDSGNGRGIFYQLRGQPYVDMAHLQTALVYHILIDSIALVWPDGTRDHDFVQGGKKVRSAILSFLRFMREEAR
jgi:hypothetical protein